MDEHYHADMAPTNRALCHRCREKITKGTPRIWYRKRMEKEVKTKDGRRVILNIYAKMIYCYRCAPDWLMIVKAARTSWLKEARTTEKKLNRMLKGKRARNAMVSDGIFRGLDGDCLNKRKMYLK